MASRRGDAPDEGPVLRFRNYQPKSEDLQGREIPKPVIPDVEEEVRARVGAGWACV